MEAKLNIAFLNICNDYKYQLSCDGEDSEDVLYYLEQMVDWVESNLDSLCATCIEEIFAEYWEMLSYEDDDDERDSVIEDFESYCEENSDSYEQDDEEDAFTADDIYDHITDSVIDKLDLEFDNSQEYQLMSNAIFMLLEGIVYKENKAKIKGAFLNSLMTVGYGMEENDVDELIKSIEEKCKDELTALFIAHAALDSGASIDDTMLRVQSFLE